MSVSRTLVILILLAICFGLACSKDNKDTSDTDKLVSLEDSTVAAIVNGEAIYIDEVEKIANQMLSLAQPMDLPPNTGEKDSIAKNEALNWLVARKLLAQEAKRQRLSVSSSVVDSSIDAIRKRFPSEEMFQQALEKEHLTLEKFRSNIQTEYEIQELLEKEITSRLEGVTEKEAREYYQNNLSKYQRPARVRARHILFRLSELATAEEEKRVRKRAQKVLALARQGKDFSELAKQYSEGPSASKGGDLGYFAKGDMVKSFDEAVFRLKVGQISDLIRTEFGYHIVKVESKEGAETIPFSEVKNNIIGFLKAKKSQERFEEYVAQLREKSDIKVRE